MKQWYEELFEHYAEHYDKEPFVAGTKPEVDFIENEINYNKALNILDIGCGTGRHAIELATRGYRVTGIDLSPAQIAKARSKAIQVGVQPEFRVEDARSLTFKREFDLVIMICEGGFSLMETDEMNFAILQCARDALRPGGRFIFTALNGLFSLFHSIKDFLNEHYTEDPVQGNTFDLMTFRDYSSYDFEDDDGNRKTVQTNERYYIPSEINWLLKSLGFSTIKILGAGTGEWNSEKLLTTEHLEMLVVAQF